MAWSVLGKVFDPALLRACGDGDEAVVLVAYFCWACFCQSGELPFGGFWVCGGPSDSDRYWLSEFVLDLLVGVEHDFLLTLGLRLRLGPGLEAEAASGFDFGAEAAPASGFDFGAEAAPAYKLGFCRRDSDFGFEAKAAPACKVQGARCKVLYKVATHLA